MPYYGDFGSIFAELEAIGVYDYLLPFLLIFTILFAILEKTKIFGQDKTNINIVLALIISLIVVADPRLSVPNTINYYLPGISLFVVVAVTFMLVAAMFAGENGFKGFGLTAGAVIAIIAVLWSLSDSEFGAGLPFLYYIDWPGGITSFVIFAALVIALIIFLTGGRRKKQQTIKLPFSTN